MTNKLISIATLLFVAFMVWMGYEFVSHLNQEQTSCLVTMGDKCGDKSK